MMEAIKVFNIVPIAAPLLLIKNRATIVALLITGMVISAMLSTFVAIDYICRGQTVHSSISIACYGWSFAVVRVLRKLSSERGSRCLTLLWIHKFYLFFNERINTIALNGIFIWLTRFLSICWVQVRP